jgi:hypothetical protein
MLRRGPAEWRTGLSNAAGTLAIRDDRDWDLALCRPRAAVVDRSKRSKNQ